jgi:hypothetical protein
MNDQHLEAVLAYLNENSGRYNLDALRNQLLQTGYDPATVDWAIQVHPGRNPEIPKPRTGRQILLVMAVNAVLAAIMIGVGALPGTSQDLLGALGFGLVVIGCAEFFSGLVMIFFEKTHSSGLGLLLGCMLSVALAFLIFTGWCIFAMATGGGH